MSQIDFPLLRRAVEGAFVDPAVTERAKQALDRAMGAINAYENCSVDLQVCRQERDEANNEIERLLKVSASDIIADKTNPGLIELAHDVVSELAKRLGEDDSEWSPEP